MASTPAIFAGTNFADAHRSLKSKMETHGRDARATNQQIKTFTRI
jgi:hypothetical protein